MAKNETIQQMIDRGSDTIPALDLDHYSNEGRVKGLKTLDELSAERPELEGLRQAAAALAAQAGSSDATEPKSRERNPQPSQRGSRNRH